MTARMDEMETRKDKGAKEEAPARSRQVVNDDRGGGLGVTGTDYCPGSWYYIVHSWTSLSIRCRNASVSRWITTFSRQAFQVQVCQPASPPVRKVHCTECPTTLRRVLRSLRTQGLKPLTQARSKC